MSEQFCYDYRRCELTGCQGGDQCQRRPERTADQAALTDAGRRSVGDQARDRTDGGTGSGDQTGGGGSR